ncbi:MAG: peptidoglycan DD-metalloendopeptidase family protein [Thermodesulfovibrionales bacterium]|nr:peptidoglycan DD-metalloendopeptidase family protein [Thermodesulfovibrionales bacterium]
MSKEGGASSVAQARLPYRWIWVFILFTFHLGLYCYAATPQEEYKKIQRETKVHKEKLGKVERRERSILADLEKTNRELSMAEAELRKYRKRLTNTESEISKVEAEISLNRGSIERQREWIKRRLRAMQKNRHPGEIVMLLSSTDDISQLMKRWKYLQYIIAYEHRVLNSYKDNLKSLHEKEKQLMMLKAELMRNEEKVRAKEADLTEKKKEKEILLASVKKEKYSYEKMLNELKEASRRLLEVIRESEKADIYHAKGFSGLKGKLPWPVEGKIAIPYGSQRDPQFDTPVFRSGIFIQTGSDLYAKAVHKGKVVFAEWFKGYGQLMIVNHGDGYHTLYGSLSEIFFKVGDIINIGQTIGRVGNSGILNAPGLYFELRYRGKPLDPLHWLKKR